MSDLSDRAYWDDRAEKFSDFRLVFLDVLKAPNHQEKVVKILSAFKDKSVLDVACGPGRFAQIFEKYVGIDFSEGMLKVAREKNPTKRFEQIDVRTEKIEGKFDIVFEVISLSSLKMTPEQFYGKWKGVAREFVICFEPDKFDIFPIYP